MLNGFEQHTAPLSVGEMIYIPRLVDALSHAQGKDLAVTNNELRRLFGLDAPRVRKLINHIRKEGLVPCLIASNKGYYVAQSGKELRGYTESLRGRESAIRAVREKIERQGAERFGRELRWF